MLRSTRAFNVRSDRSLFHHYGDLGHSHAFNTHSACTLIHSFTSSHSFLFAFMEHSCIHSFVSLSTLASIRLRSFIRLHSFIQIAFIHSVRTHCIQFALIAFLHSFASIHIVRIHCIQLLHAFVQVAFISFIHPFSSSSTCFPCIQHACMCNQHAFIHIQLAFHHYQHALHCNQHAFNSFCCIHFYSACFNCTQHAFYCIYLCVLLYQHAL